MLLLAHMIGKGNLSFALQSRGQGPFIVFAYVEAIVLQMNYEKNHCKANEIS